VRLCLCVPFALLLAAGVARPDPPAGLGPPETIFDGSDHSPILFPTFADLDGDGKTDLLVGTINRLLVVRNRGTNAKPEYGKPAWLDEAVPSARIPDG
jgi:hypothetical protein